VHNPHPFVVYATKHLPEIEMYTFGEIVGRSPVSFAGKIKRPVRLSLMIPPTRLWKVDYSCVQVLSYVHFPPPTYADCGNS
jgi:hypothetical protein